MAQAKDTPTPQDNEAESIRRNVLFDSETFEIATVRVKQLRHKNITNRSEYIRWLIREDDKREQRRAQRQLAQA